MSDHVLTAKSLTSEHRTRRRIVNWVV